MIELLAFLTVIFVIYVLYEVFKTVSSSGSEPQTTIAAPASAKPAASGASRTAAAPAPKAPAVNPPMPQPAPAAEAHKVVNLRDPLTGEVSPAPGNYRFAKKWIKEALVKEGILNKVYKNSELTESVNSRVKEALEQFKKLEKYHA